MKPGRILDALIAEKIMGWTELERRQLGTILYLKGKSLENPLSIDSVPFYSSDIRMAWEIVNKLTSRKPCYFKLVTNDTYRDEKWIAEFDLDRPFKRVWGEGDTAPHAICLAALEAVGYDKND